MAGADLCLENKDKKSAAIYLMRHLPNSIEAIEKRLDGGIKPVERSMEDDNMTCNKTVSMDYKVLLPREDKKEPDVSK